MNENNTTCNSFVIKWKDAEVYNNSRVSTPYSENYNCKISYMNRIKLFAKRDLDSCNIKHNSNDKYVLITSSCNGVVYFTIRYYNEVIFA